MLSVLLIVLGLVILAAAVYVLVGAPSRGKTEASTVGEGDRLGVNPSVDEEFSGAFESDSPEFSPSGASTDVEEIAGATGDAAETSRPMASDDSAETSWTLANDRTPGTEQAHNRNENEEAGRVESATENEHNLDTVFTVAVDPAEIPVIDILQRSMPHSETSAPDGEGHANAGITSGDPNESTAAGSEVNNEASADTNGAESADQTLAADLSFHVEPESEPEENPAPAMFVWAKEGHVGGRRLRRNWANAHGWQYDRDDELLGQQWQRFTGMPGPAHDVLAGRFAGMPARVADSGNASYLALYRTGTTDVTIEFCPDIDLQRLILGQPVSAEDRGQYAPALSTQAATRLHSVHRTPGSTAARIEHGRGASARAAGGENPDQVPSASITTNGRPGEVPSIKPHDGTIQVLAPLTRLRADVPTGPTADGAFVSRANHGQAVPLTTYTTQSDHVFVDSVSGFDMYSDDPLSARLMVDTRVAAALERLRGAAAAILIDPWVVLVKTTSRPHPEQLLEVFDAMRLLVDAARVLPSIDNGGELDLSFADPTRPWSIDDFLIGVGPTLQEAAPLEEPGSHPDPHAAWNERPDFLPRQDYLLPRRDLRGSTDRKGAALADEPTLAENTGTLPAVGEDPAHTSAHSAVGRVVREDRGEEPTIFGDRPAGRHRRRDDE